MSTATINGYPFHACSIRRHTDPALQQHAAEIARQINPANFTPAGPLMQAIAKPGNVYLPDYIAAAVEQIESDFGIDKPPAPARITLNTTKYWGAGGVKLTVGFLETIDNATRDLILKYANRWNEDRFEIQGANVEFVYTANVFDAHVRITRGGGGYASYLGPDILTIARSQPTMWLEGFTSRTPLSEYARVVTHEFGHTEGFEHEHMRQELIDLLERRSTYRYFWRDQRWTKAEVDAQVLTALNAANILGTPVDQDSVMCYQLPAEITINHQPIRGGTDINKTDLAFCAKIYPKPQTGPPPEPPPVDPPPVVKPQTRRLALSLVDLDTGAKLVEKELTV